MTQAIGIADTKNWYQFRAHLNEALPKTGDMRLVIDPTPPQGWVKLTGSIGDASSGATTRANADTSDLYSLIWANVSNTYAPVTGGRGASAAADFAAHKKMGLPAPITSPSYILWIIRL